MQKLKKALLFALILSLLLGLAACSQTKSAPENAAPVLTDGGSIGEGGPVFTLEIVHSTGESKTLTVGTDEKTVGAALTELGVIAGENTSYGLYVKTVDGETLDYDTDGKYWAFYTDGAYAAAGVDQAAAESGAQYAFRAE